MNIHSEITPYWIVGTGRCGTTAVMNVIQNVKNLVVVDEPNFLSDLYFPLGCESKKISLIESINDEGWRGATKILRVLSRDYPAYFGDNGTLPIRSFLLNEFTRVEFLINKGTFERKTLLRDSANRIISKTLDIALAERWIIKQPSAVLDWKDIISWWPNSRFLILFRDLPSVINSRLNRGYQNNFEDAYEVCRLRLNSAIALCEGVPNEQVLKLKIEDIANSPKQYLKLIFSFFSLDEDNLIDEYGDYISTQKLNNIEYKNSKFSQSEIEIIEHYRNKLNSKLKSQWV